MNLSMIRYILGYVLAVEGLLMAPCSLVGLIYGEQEGWWFLAVGAVSLALGLLIARLRQHRPVLDHHERGGLPALCIHRGDPTVHRRHVRGGLRLYYHRSQHPQ